MTIIEGFVAFFLLAGSVFVFTSSLGVLNMPDTLCRSHALSKAMTLGILLMLMSLWIHFYRESIGLKVFLAIALQFTTIPLSGHLFALYIYKKWFAK